MAAYLDHNATTPPHEDVIAAMAEALREAWANPSSLHALGRSARRRVDDAREAVAALAGAVDRDVLFTSGGTEANNLGLRRPFRGGRGLLVTSRLEHPSVVATAEALSDEGLTVRWLPVPPSGLLRPEDVERALDGRPDGPALVAIHAVGSETGVIQPVAEVLAVARAARAEVHVDAVQAAGRVPPSLWWGGDTTALAAHKLRGPKGVGAVVARPGVQVRPILRGGGQERGLRPGTVDPVACAGFGAAARRAVDGPARYAALAALRDDLEARVVSARVARTTDAPRAPHVAHLLVAGWRGDELVAALDLEGVCVSSGSACAAGTAEPSPAVSAMLGAARALMGLRVSLGETSTTADVDAFVNALARVLGRGLLQDSGAARRRRGPAGANPRGSRELATSPLPARVSRVAPPRRNHFDFTTTSRARDPLH